MATVTKQITYTSDDLDTSVSGGTRSMRFVLEPLQPIGEVVLQAHVLVNGESVPAPPIRAADMPTMTAQQKQDLRDLLILAYQDRRDAVLAAAEGTPV